MAHPDKVLITGAAGFIGRQLVQQLALLHSGIRICATDVRPIDVAALPASVVFRQLDVRTSELPELVAEERFDVVAHLASIVTPPKSMTRQEMFEIDVTATERLLAACVKAGVRKFVVTSSGAAYGYHPDNPIPLTERAALRGNSEFAYSDHKRLVEEALARFRATHPEIMQVVFRPGTVLGNSVRNQITALFDKPFVLGIKGFDSRFVFIWDADLVALLVEGIVGPIAGQFNVAGDGWLTMRELAARLNKKYLALPAALVEGGLAILKPLGLSQYGPEQTMFLKYRPVLDNSLLKATFQHRLRYTSAGAFDAFATDLS